jgi:hypothetical protein
MRKIISFLLYLFFIQFSVIAFSQNSAIIEFKETEIDYGTIKYGADGNRYFIFKNIGTTSLTLNNVKSSCGCTVPQWPQYPIAPGTTDTIKVNYSTRRSGAFNKGITIYSNAENNPVRLIIKGEVEKPTNLPVLGE